MNAGIRPIRTQAELGLVDVYTTSRQGLPGGSDVAAVRAAAFNHFALAGLPHPRIEAWRYTDLRRLMRDAKPLAAPPDAEARAMAHDAGGVFAALGFRRLVILNGSFATDISDLADLEAGLTIRSMAEALALDEPLLSQGLGTTVPADDPALALNTALAGDGVVITVSPGATIERPVHLVFVNTGPTPAAMVTRSLVVVGGGARATFVETHEGRDQLDYQINTVLQLVVGDEAQVDHVKFTREGSVAIHVGTLLANIGARAKFNELGFIAGGAVVRNQLFVLLAGEGTEANLRGLSLLADRQHADSTLAVDHAVAGSQSREIFKAVVDDEARAVFQGKITVRPQAQKTDAKMMSRALLLSDRAEADCKPELEIFADDVQCGHGATTGTLDDQLKFYLMARGIPDKEAEALLIQAFAAEVVGAIEHEGVRDALMDATVAWLGQRG
ncbi:Fe-S cluster assembly protein SufD [Bradyrhizobium sp. AUGA SZCCT0283]|uniref:Fe-S cluster assembly protein SufD n=1 Tax=Bradyrhizobium sp. AUGA SZCCT0283 TaxID=2807671 RepID=UPI001BA65B5F|nr:Fe-S cluster assembly protein SufD [Bradyrhizobium sp. AUGA SZCCT0283]MBR1280375.1 Fe-S cluster assembly protein SufD [Bradyrhizobium sp. AUGA SZCCT0283]